MAQNYPDIRARRAVLLVLLGAANVSSWARAPLVRPVPPASDADEFVIIDGWVLPRHLLRPLHAG